MSKTAATPDHSSPPLRGPFRLAIVMLCVTTATILWGALTTSTGSGMAYADWPLSDGQFMPESSYTQIPHFLEHFHRLLASSAGLIALSLWLWLAFGGRADRRATRTAFLGGCLVLTQGIISMNGEEGQQFDAWDAYECKYTCLHCVAHKTNKEGIGRGGMRAGLA